MNIAALVLIASTALAADLRVGQQAPEFIFTSRLGGVVGSMDTFEFPKSYAGKIVLIQFWASWCQPCREEMPNIRKAYNERHASGFDVIGVSIDANPRDAVALGDRFPWPMNWDAEKVLAQKYGVARIPFLLLVDGDTGKILATTNQLRGPGLSNVIARELAKKNQSVRRK